MTPRPLIFVSAVTRELHSARQLVANTLTFLGYEPVWQDIFGTESGDLRELLRRQIDKCKGVVQLVGCCYGAEPPTVDKTFGRVSYTQYEALYARERGKRVWYLVIDETFPVDLCKHEPEDLRELQASYRRRFQSDTHVFHPLTTTEGLEASVLKLRDDLTRLRRGIKRWAVGVSTALAIIIGLAIWQLRGQAEMKAEMAKLREGVMQYPTMEAQMRGSHSDEDPTALREQTYAELGKQLGVDPKILREKLPRFADELRRAPSASTYERANASYVAKAYAEAETLALQAADEAAKATPGNPTNVLQALELAGLAAHKAIRYDRAMQHFRDAQKFTDKNRNLEEWATLQHDIADLLIAEGKFNDAERLFRSVVAVRAQALGPTHPDTLDSRHRLIYALMRQTKTSEAEAEARDVLQLREKVLGLEHSDTLTSRSALAHVLASEGKSAEAETLYRKVVSLDEKMLGSEHPRTIAVREGLADVLVSEGKNGEAEHLYRQIIKLDEKDLGPDHPTTLNDRMNLATTLEAEEKYFAAEDEYKRVIELEQKVIGSEHPDILISRNNLAEVLNDEGKYAEAEAECRQIILLEQKILGPENRLTLNSRGNLAVVYIGQSNFNDAEVEYKDVLERMERVLGLEHPDTLSFAFKFAAALAHQNKTQDAKDLAKQLEERARLTLGPDNASTQRYTKLAQDLEAPR